MTDYLKRLESHAQGAQRALDGEFYANALLVLVTSFLLIDKFLGLL